MTTMAPEHVEPDVGDLTIAEHEFDIACDIYSLSQRMFGYPSCKGDPARWVAWRIQGCCGKGPQYRLVCDYCKKVYQRWRAKQAAIRCPYCSQETGGFADFTPLKGRS